MKQQPDYILRFLACILLAYHTEWTISTLCWSALGIAYLIEHCLSTKQQNEQR